MLKERFTMVKELLTVAGNLLSKGDSWEQALGVLLYRGDDRDAAKVKKAWPKVWKKYS